MFWIKDYSYCVKWTARQKFEQVESEINIVALVSFLTSHPELCQYISIFFSNAGTAPVVLKETISTDAR